MSQPVFQVEIRTRDVPRAAAFYGAVFDWKIYPAGPSYALIDPGEMPVIALLHDPRLPLGVCNNVLVDDCVQAGVRATELGGRVCVSRSEVAGSGAFVGTLDPWGNELFFWQPFTDQRPNLKGTKQNPIVFLEIATPDLARATAYYQALVGWSFWSVVFADNYAMAEGCGLKRGVGLYGGPADACGTTDYVEVMDLAATAAKIQEAGGRVLNQPTDFGSEGRYILFQDLDGNRVGAIEGRVS